MPRYRRLFVAAVTVCAVLSSMSPAAATTTAVERALERRRETTVIVRDLRGLLDDHQARVRSRVPFAAVMLAREGRGLDDTRWARILQTSRRNATRDATSLDLAKERIRARVEALGHQRDRLGVWLETTVVFRVCPVPDHTTIFDNFGEMVRLPKVPVHRHMGNDILAPALSPILAPFDGYASASWGKLGGREVRVHGSLGYVYNAHLAAVANLGPVRAGQVIGYVGETGDATAPHDHLEWHPGGGSAVDPYSLLAAACLPVSP